MKILNLLDIFCKKDVKLFFEILLKFSDFIYRMILQNNTENLSMQILLYLLCIFLFSQILDYSPRKYFPYASAALIAAHTVSGVTSNGIL